MAGGSRRLTEAILRISGLSAHGTEQITGITSTQTAMLTADGSQIKTDRNISFIISMTESSDLCIQAGI